MNLKIKVCLNKKELLFFLIGCSLLNPPYLAQLDYIGDILDVFRVCSFLMVIIFTFLNKKKISIIAIIIITSQIFIVANTINHDAAVYKSIVNGFGIISVALFYDYAVKKDAIVFVKSQFLCMEVAVYANLLTVLMFPSGLYVTISEFNSSLSNRNWFLGYYNSATQYYLPAIMFAFLNIYIGGKKSRSYMLLVAIAISAVLTWSGGVLVAVFLSAFFIFMGKKYTRLFNYFNFWFIQPIMLVLILGIQIQNVFRWFLESFLGKWDSLIGRINLWRKVCESIYKSPIIGYGMETSLVRQQKVGLFWASHSHNLILDILYQGGIVYLGFFVLLVCLCGRKMMKNRNNFVVVIITAAFGGWSVHSIVEPFITPFLMGMFIVGYYSDRIINAGVDNNIYKFANAK
jgi:O-antigen ligase